MLFSCCVRNRIVLPRGGIGRQSFETELIHEQEGILENICPNPYFIRGESGPKEIRSLGQGDIVSKIQVIHIN